MAVFKRGRVYWFHFVFNGEHVQCSTKQRNRQAAINIESAYRTKLAKGEAGLEHRAPAPTLKAFEKKFGEWIDETKENVRTREFYKTSYKRLIDFAPLGRARMDRIDEALIENFKSAMLADKLNKATVNRYLATLRKALRYASRKLKLFDKLPIVEMYPGERQREFIFSDADYKNWIAIAPEPLRSASILARNAGICRGEMLALQRDCVSLLEEPDDNGLWGQVEIKRGLKRDCRRRVLQVNAEMRDVLVQLMAKSKCDHLFTAMQDHKQPLSPYTLEDQLRRTRVTLKLHDDAGLHTLRHTFLTEMGTRTDAFTLQYIAGHRRITTTMRYVHPQQESVTRAFSARESGRKTVATVSATSKDGERNVAVYN